MGSSSSKKRMNGNDKNSTQETATRNDWNIMGSNSLTAPALKAEKNSGLLGKPVRTLREVFKSIKKKIRKQSKVEESECSSEESHSEHSIEFEDCDDCDSEFEVEMDTKQRQILEQKVINMVMYWNDIENKSNDFGIDTTIKVDLSNNKKQSRDKRVWSKKNTWKVINSNNVLVKDKSKVNTSKPRSSVKSKKKDREIKLFKNSEKQIDSINLIKVHHSKVKMQNREYNDRIFVFKAQEFK